MTSLTAEPVDSSQPIPDALAEALRDYEFSLVVAEAHADVICDGALPTNRNFDAQPVQHRNGRMRVSHCFLYQKRLH